MDFHPIVVHFPVALLTGYAAMELVRIKRLLQVDTWFWIKTVFLLAGWIGALAAYKTGELATGEIKNVLIQTHSTFAKFTVIVFGLLAILYAIRVLARWFGVGFPILAQLSGFTERIRQSWVMGPAALIGLFAITFTGALGGAIVYGPDVDPFVSIIYKLVVK